MAIFTNNIGKISTVLHLNGSESIKILHLWKDSRRKKKEIEEAGVIMIIDKLKIRVKND